MGKRGQLTKAEKYYIETNIHSLGVAEMAKWLGTTDGRVQNHVDKWLKEHPPVTVPVTTEEDPNAKLVEEKRKAAKELFTGKTDGVVVMGAGASEHGDDFKKSFTGPVKDTSSYIFRGNK